MSSPTTPHDPVDTAAAAEAARDRRARITWSLIAEPSDAVALLACTVLGHTTALELAENGTSPDLLRALGGHADAELFIVEAIFHHNPSRNIVSVSHIFRNIRLRFATY